MLIVSLHEVYIALFGCFYLEDKDNVFASYELWPDFNIPFFNFFLLWRSFYSPVYFLTFFLMYAYLMLD